LAGVFVSDLSLVDEPALPSPPPLRSPPPLPSPLLLPAEDDLAVDSPDADEVEESDDFDPELALERSFFAHPLPLKTIDGVVSSFFMGPPHCSHVLGPLALTP
jgi:hypothetical protein